MRKVFGELKNKNKKFIHLVFICTANCCRSPLAEILFEKMLINTLGSKEALGRKGLYIDSAGISYSGMKMSENSMEVLVSEERISRERCLAHRGKLISELDNPDLLLTMAENHLQYIRVYNENLASLAYRLDDFVKTDLKQPGFDIPDPIGRSYSDYCEMKNLVKEDLILLMEEMKDVGIL